MYDYFPFIVRLIAALAGGAIANSKGRDKLAWAIACFAFPPVVVAVLLLHPQLRQGKTKKCPYCAKILYREEGSCKYCGRELPIELVQCRQCGNFVPDKQYCVQCNRKL